MHRLLAPADYRRVPWKNGGGRTTEIAVDPAGGAADGFAWRVSIADVEADGPFSAFPGIERTIALVSGAGMRLTIGDRPVELRVPFEPYTFDGGATVDCKLVAGPVRDFNLMIRRDAARGLLTVVRDGGVRIAAAHVRVIHAYDGAVEALVPGHPPLAVAAERTLVVDGDDARSLAIVINPLAADAVALVASIDPVA